VTIRPVKRGWRSFALLLLLVCSLRAGTTFAADDTDAFTPTERAWLGAHPRIVLGAGDGWAPHAMRDANGRSSGFIVDHAVLLSRVLGVDVRIETGPWEEIIEKAKAGQLHGLTLTAPLEERKSHFLFTDAFLKLDELIYLRTEDQGKPGAPRRLDDLRGKRVGYLKGIQREKRLFDERPGIIAIPMDSYEAVGKALLERKIDAAVAAYTLEHWRLTSNTQGFGFTDTIPEAETQIGMSIGKGYPELVGILNKALATLTTDELFPLYQRWYGDAYATRTRLLETSLNDAERAWLVEHPVIRVGMDPQWAPIEFKDTAGKPQGMSIAYLNRIGAQLGLRFEVETGNTWPESIRKLMAKEIDLLPAIAANDERRKTMRFTQPYLSVPAAIFSSLDTAYLGGMTELKGKRVLVLDGEAVLDWLRREWPELAVTAVANTREALTQVADDPSAAFIGNLITTSYYIGQTGLRRVKVAGEAPFVFQLSIAVRDDWPVLLGILQKGLNAIPAHERERIYNDWISIRYEQHDHAALFMAAAVAGVVLLMVIVERSLRLRRSNARLRQLAREISQVEERERHRLATELHDSPMQKLALAQMQISAVTNQPSHSSVDRMHSGLSLMREAMDELHTLQFELSPPMLYRDGLGPALDWLATHATERLGLRFAYTGPNSPVEVPQPLAVLLFQCARELVYNAVKHSGARSGTIVFGTEGGKVMVTVSDDGAGIDDNRTNNKSGGFGLNSLRDRMALAGGELRIYTAQGAAVTLSAPLRARGDSGKS